MASLYILNGPEKGRIVPMEAPILYVGRGPGNDVVIQDNSVSRKHLEIRQEEDGFTIRDLGSTNGTFINGKRIWPEDEVGLKKGLPVTVGNILISLGKIASGEGLTLQHTIDLSERLDETGTFDRPMTSPKNLELIYKVSSVLIQSLDIHEILEHILEYIFDLLKRIDRGAIILTDENSGEVSEVISKTENDQDGETFYYSHSIVDRTIQECRAVIMSDTMEEESGPMSHSMELMKIRSVMCVPLISRSKTRGVIYVDSVNRPYGFRKEDLSLVTALSSPAAIAIENALLYANSEKIIEERTKSLLETEKKLRESEARFKAMFDNMSSGVTVFEVAEEGKKFTILDLNRSDERIEGIRKKDILGKSAKSVFPNLENMGLLDVFKRVWMTGKPERRSSTLYRNGRITAWREYYVYRLPSGEIVSIFDDVTDRKRAEEEQKALQDQLLVSQKMESIGAFAGGTAHNFRNILQAISGNIEYLEMIYGDHPEIKELSKGIYDSVEKGVDLINNLLHFSKRGGAFQSGDLDIADVIDRTAEIIEKVFNRNIEIKKNVEKGLYVKGNQSLLSQVFMNLFTNARDAMPEGGFLKVEAKKRGNKIEILVHDTGHGMDTETVKRIFDPFFTLKDVGKGTGLGLSTSHGIVEQHHGTIRVSSTPGKGTTFSLRFPYVIPKQIHLEGGAKSVVYGQGQKILIVDDEGSVLDSLAGLADRLGYQAIPLDKSTEALQRYQEHAPDLVIMDRNMPEMDGIACIRQIIKADPNARIVIVSGYEESGPDGIDQTVRDAIKGYLTKPCGIEDLSQMIATALKE